MPGNALINKAKDIGIALTTAAGAALLTTATYRAIHTSEYNSETGEYEENTAIENWGDFSLTSAHWLASAGFVVSVAWGAVVTIEAAIMVARKPSLCCSLFFKPAPERDPLLSHDLELGGRNTISANSSSNSTIQ